MSRTNLIYELSDDILSVIFHNIDENNLGVLALAQSQWKSVIYSTIPRWLRRLAPEELEAVEAFLRNARLKFSGFKGRSWEIFKKIKWKQFGRIVNSSRLSVVGVRLGGMDDKGLIDFAPGLMGSQVTELDLASNSVGDGGLVALARKLNNTPLTSLDISFNPRIGDIGIQEFSITLQNSTSLTELRLGSSLVSDNGISHLAAVLPKSHLIALDLSGSNMTAEGATTLASALPQCSLRKLDLKCNPITDIGVTTIASVLSRSKLQRLYLGFVSLSDAGAQSLAAQLPFCQLLELCAESNAIGDKGATAVAHALPKSKVVQLRLGENQIGDEGAMALARNLPTNNLELLDMRYNVNLGPKGATALTAVEKLNPSLKIPAYHDNLCLTSTGTWLWMEGLEAFEA